MNLPLKGVRILTLEQFGAGPYGSMLLADLGADVIKVENPFTGGDASRAMGPHFLGEHDSHYFQTFSLNKRSVGINLKSDAGQEAFHALVRTADAVLNNFRGDQAEKLGLDYAALGRVNERIVCAHISAYGRDNDRKSWPGYDYLMQAEAGWMQLTGEPGAPPARCGLSIVDFMTGTTAALALVSALLGVSRSGRGQDVDVSLFDVALHQLSYPGNWYLNEATRTERLPRSAHPSAVPVQLYATSDAWIFLMCMTQKFWQLLIAEIGRPELGEDPRFADPRSRRENMDALTPILDAEFVRDSTDNWLKRLCHLLPAAPVYDIARALDSPYVHQIGMVREVPHPHKPDFRALANPIKLAGARLPSKVCSPLAADTDTLLREAGLDDEAMDRLGKAGAILR